MEIFDEKSLAPMTLFRSEAPFDSPDFIYELKLDGLRTLAYLSESDTDLRNKKNTPLLPKFPELRKLHLAVNAKCILDGELIVLRHGIPDFLSLQDRLFERDFHLWNQENKVASKNSHYISAPACFVAYDILYYKDHFVTNLPLIERKRLLEDVVHENLDLSISRYVEGRGSDLMQLAHGDHLEGVIAKRRNSLYHVGESSPDWIKFQQSIVIPYVLCGSMISLNGLEYFLLGQYRDDQLIYRGCLDLLSYQKNDKKILSSTKRSRLLPERIFDLPYYYRHYPIKEIADSPFDLQPLFDSSNIITWFEPNLVCSIKFPSQKKTAIKHGILKGIRDDIDRKECIFR